MACTFRQFSQLNGCRGILCWGMIGVSGVTTFPETVDTAISGTGGVIYSEFQYKISFARDIYARRKARKLVVRIIVNIRGDCISASPPPQN